MYKYLSFILILIAYAYSVYAQQLNGFVKNVEGEPVSYATVALLEESDSLFLYGAVTGEDGSFHFDCSSSGRLLKVTCLGYNPEIVPAADSVTVILTCQPQQLKDVVVTGHKPTFKMEKGVLVSTIEGTAYSKLGMAADVLRQLPMMSIDGKSIIGRGTPLIYINGRKMRNASELDRITSDMIKEIKIDMAPGAKYGSGPRAVLHITTNRPAGEGLGGYIGLSESISSYWNTYGYFSLNYRKKGLDVFFSGTYNTFCNRHYMRNDTYEFIYEGKDVHADYEMDAHDSQKTGTMHLGFNYQISPSQQIGAYYYLLKTFPGKTQYRSCNRKAVYDQTVSSYNDNAMDTHGGNQYICIYYENNFGDNLSMNVDGTYYHYSNCDMQTMTWDKDEIPTVASASRSHSDMIALNTAFSSDLLKGKLDYGFEGTHTHYRQRYKLRNDGNSKIGSNSDNESRHTAGRLFMNWSRQFKNVFAQAGVKYEYANYKYYSMGVRLNESCKTYHNLLPSISLSWKQRNVNIMLGYNVDMSRPGYGELDESLVYISPIRYARGNSKLETTYNHCVSLTSIYRDIVCSFDYTYVKNGRIAIFHVLEQEPAVLSTTTNHSYPTTDISITFSPTLFKIWKASLNIFLHKQWLRYEEVSYNKPVIGINWKNMITMPNNWTIIVNTSLNLKGNVDTYMANTNIMLNMYVQKKIGRWSITTGANNILNSKEKGYSNYTGLYTSHFVNSKAPTFYATLTYTFNPTRSRYKGKTAGKSEIDRM